MHLGSILSTTLRGGSLAVAVGFAMWATVLDAKAMSEQEAHAIGVDAYLYFYSLITMDLTRKQLTNVEPGKGFGGPTNTFANVPAYPTAEDRAVVRPNFDTLYSSAWLARHVDRCVCFSGLAHYRHASADIRQRATRMATRPPR